MSGQPRTTGLPTTWHEVRDERTGDLLYWRREHSGYEVWPHGHQFSPCLEMQPIAPLCATLTQAIVACREHMHAASNNSST